MFKRSMLLRAAALFVAATFCCCTLPLRAFADVAPIDPTAVIDKTAVSAEVQQPAEILAITSEPQSNLEQQPIPTTEEIRDAVNNQIAAEVVTEQILLSVAPDSVQSSELSESTTPSSGTSGLAESPILASTAPALLAAPVMISNDEIGIRVPEGFAVEFGYQQSYKHIYMQEEYERDNVHVYNCSSRKTYFYRVYSVEENNDAVTYWGWLTAAEYTASKGTIIEVTEEMLSLNDEGKTKEVELAVLNEAGQQVYDEEGAPLTEKKTVNAERNADTVDEYLQNNQYDTQDILITGNQDGHVNLNVGDTWTLNCYRMWEIIESFMNANISQPDFHIEVIGVDGNPTDVVEIQKNTGDGSANTVIAKSKGTVILKITYDAVTVDSAMGGEYFSAIAPENTALLVVSVEGSKINDGINLDSEVDVQYYTGNDGASVLATPDEGSTVRVSRCGYNSTTGAMELGVFEDVDRNEDGTFTLGNLREGSSVVEVTDAEGRKSYQVIKTKEIEFVIKDADGNVITDYSALQGGDTITIVADKFYDVFMKTSGVYNGSAALQFTDNFGNVFKAKENASGFAIQYTQAGDPQYRTVTVTLPGDFDPETYELTCSVYRDTKFGLKLTGHRTVYKNTGETALNGYAISYSSATSVSEAGAIISNETKLLENDIIDRNHDLVGVEVIQGVVKTMNSDKVVYKNVE